MKADHARTLAIVKELAQGKTIKVNGLTIGMGEDMSIGAMFGDRISGLSTMDLAQFNELLSKNDIHMPPRGNWSGS